MPRFNLLDQPWIPVRFASGATDEIGLLEVFRRSHELVGIESASPLITGGGYRLLLAVVYRALQGPCSRGELKTLREEGLSTSRIEAYLEHWRPRFDLFDPEHPFLQNGTLRGRVDRKTKSWTELDPLKSKGTRNLLWDHSTDEQPGSCSYPEAARLLVASTGFSICGGRGLAPSPQATGMLGLLRGHNLAETLLLNLTPYPSAAAAARDSAQWERDADPLPPVGETLAQKKVRVKVRDIKGYADLYTWAPRSVALIADLPYDRVSECRFIEGWGASDPSYRDPMHCYYISGKKAPREVSFDPTRETWRNYPSLLSAPGCLGLAALEHYNASQAPVSLQLLGLHYTPPKANLTDWFNLVLPTSQGLLQDPAGRACLEAYLYYLERGALILRNLCRVYAEFRVHCKPPKWKDKPAGPVASLIAKSTCLERYWDLSKERFLQFVQAYKAVPLTEERELPWRRAVWDTIDQAWSGSSVPFNDPLSQGAVSSASSYFLNANVIGPRPKTKSPKPTTSKEVLDDVH